MGDRAPVDEGAATCDQVAPNRKSPSKSWFAWLEQHPYFQMTTLGVIVLNAAWISVDVQYNHPKLEVCDDQGTCKLPLQPVSDGIDQFFCVYFFTEVLVRCFAFRNFLYFWKDGWFVFDSVLVMFMVLESWIFPLAALLSDTGRGRSPLKNFSSLRLLRLLRLTRMARIMRFFPELMTLVQGMMLAARSVIFILVFLVLIMYVFAIIFTGQLGDPTLDLYPEEPAINLKNLTRGELISMIEDLQGQVCGSSLTSAQMFASMGDSMMSLLTNGLLGDGLAVACTSILNGSQGIFLFYLFILFMCISSFTLLNMLIGVVCQVIEATAKSQEEIHKASTIRQVIKEALATVRKDRNEALATVRRCDDGSTEDLISKDDWDEISNKETVKDTLVGLGMERYLVHHWLSNFGRLTFEGSGEDGKDSAEVGKDGQQCTRYTLDTIVDKVFELRWDKAASIFDVTMMTRSIEKKERATTRLISNVSRNIKKVVASSAARSPTNQPLKDQTTIKSLQDVPTRVLLKMLRAKADEMPVQI